MWDSTPFVQALLATAHPSVREAPELVSFIEQALLLEGERRPQFAHIAAAELIERPLGFVYDRSSGLIFAGGYADHERCASALMRFHELRSPVDDWKEITFRAKINDGKAAERYLEEGFGFLANSPQLTRSSGMWPLNVGSGVNLSAEEKIWFRNMSIRR